MEVIERRDSVVSGAKAWRIGGDFVWTMHYTTCGWRHLLQNMMWYDVILYIIIYHILLCNT